MARKYAHIWDRLKLEQHLIITSPASSHKTILRALRAESARDTVFRFKCVEKGRHYHISFNSVGDMLVIRLEWKQGVPRKFVNHKGRR
jgi:hypothetical protein